MCGWTRPARLRRAQSSRGPAKMVALVGCAQARMFECLSSRSTSRRRMTWVLNGGGVMGAGRTGDAGLAALVALGPATGAAVVVTGALTGVAWRGAGSELPKAS